jgi:hypothetical protein
MYGGLRFSFGKASSIQGRRALHEAPDRTVAVFHPSRDDPEDTTSSAQFLPNYSRGNGPQAIFLSFSSSVTVSHCVGLQMKSSLFPLANDSLSRETFSGV